MRTKHLQLVLVIIMSLLISCKKDKDNNTMSSPGKLTYDGKEYPLDKGYIHNDLGTRFNVSLFSSGITVNNSNGGLFLDGKGNGVLLILDSTVPTDISAGTYLWPSQTTPGSLMIADAQIGITNDITTSINGTFRAADDGSGSVTVAKAGLEYTIQFSVLVDGKTASGSFTGALQNY